MRDLHPFARIFSVSWQQQLPVSITEIHLSPQLRRHQQEAIELAQALVHIDSTESWYVHLYDKRGIVVETKEFHSSLEAAVCSHQWEWSHGTQLTFRRIRPYQTFTATATERSQT